MNVKLHFDRTKASYNPIATKVRNNTKRLEWIYGPSFFGVPNDEEQVIWLSHWKFGNQLEGGDLVKVSVLTISELRVKECGVEIVYDEREEKMMNTQQNTTDIAPSFSGFDIGGNLSPSDMATMGQMRTYFLCCRPEELRESETHRSKWFNQLNSGFDETTVCFGEEAICGESRSGIIAHDPRLPEGRGCTMQIKAFFRSLPLVVSLSLRDSYGLAWHSCFESRQNFRYFSLSSQDLPSPGNLFNPVWGDLPIQTLRRTADWCSSPIYTVEPASSDPLLLEICKDVQNIA